MTHKRRTKGEAGAVVIFTESTLILLIYHASLDSCSLFLKPEPKQSTKNPRVWNIHAVKKQLGPDICSHIVFLHVILGCDTTSQPHGIGKGNSLKKFRDCDHLRDLAVAFNSPSATAEENSTAGEQVLVTIYNGKPAETLDLYDTSVFVRKWSETHLTFNPRLYHQHQLQPSFTAFTYTSKYNSGKEQGMAFCQRNGGGERVKMKYLSQLLLICCLLQMISCVLFDVTASQIVVQ